LETVKVLGIPITVTSKEELLHRIEKAILEHHQLTLVAINARKVIRMIDDQSIKDLIELFDVYIADGQSIVNAVDQKIERITGIDLMMAICEYAPKINARIFLYGASQKSNQLAKEKLKKMYPHILIVGSCDGYNDQDVIKKINESQADIVFVAKGTPQQEIWIQEHKNFVCANVFLGVGGGFDVLSGQVKRAPKWIQQIGLEWFYRMILQPQRFRQIPELWKFQRMVNKEKRKNKGDICL